MEKRCDSLIHSDPNSFLKFAQISEYRFLKANFESKVDFRLHTDYLRCSPSYHTHPRYDCIIFQTAPGEFTCARLIFVFTCEVEGKDYPVALVHPYDHHVSHNALRDRHLGFYRYKAKPRAQSEFISTRSIIRGAVLAEDPEHVGEALLVDIIDTDMFLRMQGDRF
jgi:hypothetical protein